MAKKAETPFHKIQMVRSKLGLYVKYGDAALGDQTPQEFAADLQECIDHLMTFRNIVNRMVQLDEPPARAAMAYAEDETGN